MRFEKYEDFIIMDISVRYNESSAELAPLLFLKHIFYIWKEPLNASTAIILSLKSECLLPNELQNIKIGVIPSEFSQSIKVGDILNWGALQHKLGQLTVNKVFLPLKITTATHRKVKTLYRPVNQHELDLIIESNYTKFPQRKKEQPFFYPVLNEEYASKIAKEWNVPAYGVGYVTKFDVREDYLTVYEVQNVGGKNIEEYWIPAEDLDLFNICIVGKIEVIKKYENRI